MTLAVFALASCNTLSETVQGRILFMGDSLMALHGGAGLAVADVVARTLDEPVTDRSVAGARINYILPVTGSLGLKVAKQYRNGPWDWVVLNGGGNDLWLGCGCYSCDATLDKLVADDGGNGRIPDLVRSLRADGARVIYVGYLRSPGVGSPIEDCRDDGDALEARIATMAALDNGVFFLTLADLVPHGDRSYHLVDMIHPSMKASEAIGQRVANLIREIE